MESHRSDQFAENVSNEKTIHQLRKCSICGGYEYPLNTIYKVQPVGVFLYFAEIFQFHIKISGRVRNTPKHPVSP